MFAQEFGFWLAKRDPREFARTYRGFAHVRASVWVPVGANCDPPEPRLMLANRDRPDPRLMLANRDRQDPRLMLANRDTRILG